MVHQFIGWHDYGEAGAGSSHRDQPAPDRPRLVEGRGFSQPAGSRQRRPTRTTHPDGSAGDNETLPATSTQMTGEQGTEVIGQGARCGARGRERKRRSVDIQTHSLGMEQESEPTREPGCILTYSTSSIPVTWKSVVLLAPHPPLPESAPGVLQPGDPA